MHECSLFAVTGKPIGHSLSPDMFNAVFEHVSSNSIYLRLAADSAGHALSMMRAIGIAGLNVTSPFKEEIIPFLDGISEIATKLGAVNAVYLRDGRYMGTNTDVDGVCGALNYHDVHVKDKSVLILGAGGAAKAAAFGVQRMGAADIVIISRNVSRAEKAAGRVGCSYEDFGNLEENVKKANLIISCLPRDVWVLDPMWISDSQVVFDANYSNDRYTVFRNGSPGKCIDGSEWLLHQAVSSYRAFTGEDGQKDLMREALMRGQEKKSNVALVGFMGSGKSTIAETLSKNSGLYNIDTDKQIEKIAGKSISDIFAADGETVFRDIEDTVLGKLIGISGTVISCGGGAILHKNTFAEIKKNAHVVWLWVSPEAAVKRAAESRPLLQVDEPLQVARKILSERIPAYASVSDVIIDTNHATPNEIAQRIENEIN